MIWSPIAGTGKAKIRRAICNFWAGSQASFNIVPTLQWYETLAQGRLQKRINERLALLPEYKRQYADKTIKAILGKYFGESESKVEPVVSVILDALERTDYRIVLEYIHKAEHSDMAKLAEVLAEFGLAEIAIIGEQAKSRLEFLDRFEALCNKEETDEKLIHSSLKKTCGYLVSNTLSLAVTKP